MKLLLCARYALSGSEWLDISLEIWLIAYMQQVIYSSLNTANRFFKKKYFIFSRFLKIMFKANTRHHVFFFFCHNTCLFVLFSNLHFFYMWIRRKKTLWIRQSYHGVVTAQIYATNELLFGAPSESFTAREIPVNAHRRNNLVRF